MADNDRWRNDPERDRYRSRGGQHEQYGRSEGRYEDFGGRPDQGRFMGEEPSRGGEGRYAEQGRHEGYGGRSDREGGYRRGSEGHGGQRGGYGRNDDRGRYGEGRGHGSGRGQQGGGFGGDYYSGFYGADQNYGRGRSDERDRSYGGSSGDDRSRYGGDYGYGERDNYRRGGYADYGRSLEGESRGYGGYGDRDRDVTGYRSDQERGFFERAGDEIASWFGDDAAARRREQDARQGDQGAQHHRGRGPKGYTRSDERIREDVSDRLTDDPYVDASEIEVNVSGSEVTLTGTVDSREARRRAEDIAESVGGVTHVQNNLRVPRQGSSGGSSSAFGTGAGSSSGTSAPTDAGTTSGAASRSAASQGVTTPPMGESITGMNSSDANRILQETFDSTAGTTGSKRS